MQSKASDPGVRHVDFEDLDGKDNRLRLLRDRAHVFWAEVSARHNGSECTGRLKLGQSWQVVPKLAPLWARSTAGLVDVMLVDAEYHRDVLRLVKRPDGEVVAEVQVGDGKFRVFSLVRLGQLSKLIERLAGVV